jgi:hypothetical protein
VVGLLEQLDTAEGEPGKRRELTLGEAAALTGGSKGIHVWESM